MSYYHLIYISYSTIESVDDALLEILKKAQSVNYNLRISGLLVYHKNKFMQLLEGDKREVKNLFAKIQLDPRHKDVKILLELDSPKRCFSTWAMGFGMTGCSSSLISEQPFYFSINDIKEICSALKGSIGEEFLNFINT